MLDQNSQSEIDPSQEQMKYFLKYIHKFVKSWQTLIQEDLIVLNTIGITNQTYILKQKQYPKGNNDKTFHLQVQPEYIIFRIYGKTCEGVYLDRERELKVIETLQKNNLAPKYYGVSEKVRIEEYLESRILMQEQMKIKRYSRKVAYTLAQLHKVEIPMIDKITFPLKVLDKNGLIMPVIRDKIQQKEIYTLDEQQIIDELSQWFIDSELDFIKSKLPSSQSVCFSHNDLLANNILICPPDDRFVFIDFEYSSYNYRGFDIGSYFSESQFNYNNDQPPYFLLEQTPIDQAVVNDFFSVYSLTSINVIRDIGEIHQISLSEDNVLENIIKGLSQEIYAEYKQRFDEIRDQFSIACLFSHFFCGGWAIINSHSSVTTFDYITYAQSRFTKYKELKKQIMDQE